MPQKNEVIPSTLADVLDRMAGKDYAFNFDITLEINTPSLRVGSVRVQGHVESAPLRKR